MIRLEAESLVLGGEAAVQAAGPSSNAGNGHFVTGLGCRFETAEHGAEGYGDRTRAVADEHHVPVVRSQNRGTMTIPKGTVPAGTYVMSVSFSNNAFIGQHSYNPQVADLGLQVRTGSGHGAEIARGSFRYAYTDQYFMNRSMVLTTDGSALVLGNWDPVGTGRGAVSWGVAPNADAIVFSPVLAAR